MLHRCLKSLCFLLTILTLLVPGGAALAQTVPAGLPQQFAFGARTGLLDAPTLAAGGMQWRYAYLTGGLGANDWTRWQPDGAYARQFLEDSAAAGLTPVFSYYQIVPAKPNRYVEPPFANLVVPATMNAYFANWKRMLEICAAWGKTVVVHIEPDLLGYMQARSSEPSSVPVAVSTSGHADASGQPDNAVGLMKTLTTMRDRYAPNVLLAWQASQWATGMDLYANQADPTEQAEATAAYFARFGTPYDLIFSEFSDRDSGYYQSIGENRWWKEDDFERFRRYLARLSSLTGKRIVLWQIPMGNTLYSTLNNTRNHYQDNRAEYFLAPVVDGDDRNRLAHYAEAGVIALLFGGGADDQTAFSDFAGDGTTQHVPFLNPANGTGRQNALPPRSADDDGGFLRHALTIFASAPSLALPATIKADFDRIFDWAEQTYPWLFTGTANTESYAEYRIRRYANGNILGHRQDRIYVYGPSFGGLIDLGATSPYLDAARADGY